MKNTGSDKGLKLLKQARAKAYKRYFIWLAQNKDVRKELEVSLLKIMNR